MERGWILRDALSAEDWEQALQLLSLVYVNGGFTPAQSAAVLFSRNQLEGRGDLLLAAAGEQILGTVFLVAAQSDLRQVARPGESEFRLLAVANAARREGIGRQLVAECLKRATLIGSKRMVLSTQPSMKAAHALYERLGFRRAPERDWQTSGGGVRWVYIAELGRSQEMHHYTIRQIQEGDYSEWREMWDAYCAFHEVSVPDVVTKTTWGRILDPNAAVHGLIACDSNGKPVAFANYVLHPHTWSEKTVCYLEDLYTQPEVRGRGVGRSFIEHLVALGNEHDWKRVYWHTDIDNVAARRLYDRFRLADDYVRYTLTLGLHR